jgi:hypothetical protein
MTSPVFADYNQILSGCSSLTCSLSFRFDSGNYQFNSYLGAGATGTIGEDSNVELALFAGADCRFAQNYVANGSGNYAPFANDNEIGFSLGVSRIF